MHKISAKHIQLLSPFIITNNGQHFHTNEHNLEMFKRHQKLWEMIDDKKKKVD